MVRMNFVHVCTPPCRCFGPRDCDECGQHMTTMEASYWDDDMEVIRYIWVCPTHGPMPPERAQA